MFGLGIQYHMLAKNARVFSAECWQSSRLLKRVQCSIVSFVIANFQLSVIESNFSAEFREYVA